MTDNGNVPAALTDPRHIAAWQALTEGMPHSAAAKKAGVDRTTIQRWLRKWRHEHGEDLFEDEAEAARKAQTEAARAARDAALAEADEALITRLVLSANRQLDAADYGPALIEATRTVETEEPLIGAQQYSFLGSGSKGFTTAAAVAIDKFQLLRGKPTSRNENVDPMTVREEREQLQRDLSPEVIDLAAEALRRAG